ncbi:protein lin-52 homolog isoform X1 [Branchiostoma floridae]|uniref:Protein lin-52 homolog n=1 Tax=Branchiostoma floridae TaxID=7739 RepID=A0A9J7M8A2_BRAFL|nr:protein lin-52 homolog isoform X1 [Branchiostoma floridae]XP_035696584.1 protein lin-52 homolog isoform X1 [Branchiostoma floridae]
MASASAEMMEIAESGTANSASDSDAHAELNQSGDVDSLLSLERLDRASPELWPEQIPGVSEFAYKSVSINLPGKPLAGSASATPKWVQELEKDDIDMLQEFGSLTTANLMEKVRGLQNLAYQLGLDEAREMTRGKFLNILEKNPSSSSHSHQHRPLQKPSQQPQTHTQAKRK